MLSREALFLLNNLLFMSVLVVCFWGVIFPLMSELVTGQKVTVGPPFYTRATGPLFATLILLMGVAPLSAWGHSTLQTLWRSIWKPAVGAALVTLAIFLFYTKVLIALLGFFLVALVILVTFYEYWRGARARQKTKGENVFAALGRLTARNPRRYGGYLVHISMMLMAIGIMGINMFQVDTQGTIPVNGSLRLGEYSVKYESIAQFDAADNRQVTRAVVGVYDNNGKYLGELHPRIDYYPDAQQNMTIPGERATLRDDLYVLLVDWQPANANGATFKVFVNPLVNWLWIGALVFAAGILVAVLLPDRGDPERFAVPVVQPSPQTSAAD